MKPPLPSFSDAKLSQITGGILCGFVSLWFILFPVLIKQTPPRHKGTKKESRLFNPYLDYLFPIPMKPPLPSFSDAKLSQITAGFFCAFVSLWFILFPVLIK